MFDIVAAYDQELALAVEIETVDEAQTRHAVAAAFKLGATAPGNPLQEMRKGSQKPEDDGESQNPYERLRQVQSGQASHQKAP
jgi:hypothetical protein